MHILVIIGFIWLMVAVPSFRIAVFIFAGVLFVMAMMSRENGGQTNSAGVSYYSPPSR